MTGWWLGLDPARTGAAVLLAPDRAPTVAYCWRPRQRQGRSCYELSVVAAGGHQRRETVATLHHVGVQLVASVFRVVGEPTWGVAAEAPYVSRLNPSTGLLVAISTGELVGPMRERMRYPLLLTKASEWRQELLGLHHRTERARAKRVSLATMPQRLPGLGGLLERTAQLLGADARKLDHVTDAGGVAEYGYLNGEADRDADPE